MLSDIWLLLIGSTLALSVGSFLNVIIYRLPRQILDCDCSLTLASPASHCPFCNIPLRWRDKLPLLSWMMLRGRCHHCKQPISWRYPATECASWLLAAILYWLLPWNATLFAALLLCWMLLTLSMIDIEHLLLPDALTLPLLWLGLLMHVFATLPGTVVDAVLGAAGGYLSLRLLTWIHHFWRGVNALGMGDAKLLAALGAWLGWQALPNLLIIAAGSGIIASLAAHLFLRRALNQPMAFGPWLSLAGTTLFIRQLLV